MSNNWYYKLFFGSELDFRDRVIKVFKILKRHKILLRRTQDSPIILRDATGLKQFEFQNEWEAVEFLSKEGGLLQLSFMLDPLTEWDFNFYIFFTKYSVN